jgi:Ca2+-binding EF-hand superfamily protein
MNAAKETPIKLNKETLEALLSQKETLKTIKKDQLINLYKLLDGKFSEEEIEEFEKLFNSFDPDQKNEMPVTQLGTALRILQQLPTDNEVAQLIETINPKKPEGEKKAASAAARKSAPPKKNSKGGAASAAAGEEEQVETIDFYKFLLGLGLYMRNPLEIADEIKAAFKVLDRSKQGYIMTADLREFLSQLGDCLTDEEINEMITLADTESNGKIEYEKFVDYMTTLKLSKKKGKKGKKKKKKK